MASWNEVVEAAPDFAASVARRLEQRRHKTLSTLRRDGTPRVNGIETFSVDGDIYIGSMADSHKAADLRRDQRFALHCVASDPPEGDPSGWDGDVSLSGRAVEIVDREEVNRIMQAAGHTVGDDDLTGSSLFRLDIAEVVSVRVHESLEYLEIETWHAPTGYRRFERY